VKTPAGAASGLYRATVRIAPERGRAVDAPLELTVRRGTLDAVDLPAGPWGHTINPPWRGQEAAAWNDTMAVTSLRKIREYGFTSCSGLPVVTYRGLKDGAPVLDSTVGDAQMKRLRDNGFTMPVITYCAFVGLNTYYKDGNAMKRAGFTEYDAFSKALFGAVQEHADEAGWLPVYWSLGDKPIGDDLRRSAENVEAYRRMLTLARLAKEKPGTPKASMPKPSVAGMGRAPSRSPTAIWRVPARI